jgi:4'-phosphopantetheinyl transferase
MALRCIPAPDVQRVLEAGEIQVWSIDIAAWLPVLGVLAEVLNPAERERAARFRFERDLYRFTLCRGLLRMLLGNYLSLEPQEVGLQAGPRDKPELASAAEPRLEFNLSHSDQAALFAFALSRRVGVDVERIHSRTDVMGLGRQVFTEAEMARLSAAPEQGKEDLFFTLWTQKEAFIKAIGLGLSAPLREITVGQGLVPSGEDSGIGVIHRYDADWSLVGLPAQPGYKAALAIEGRLGRESLRVRPLLPPEEAHADSEPQA